MLNILLSIVGFILLIKCAGYFVDGASSLAKNFKISTTVIGLTIVAFGTSAPEIAISFNSHLSGNTDMFFGSVIGSNIANILIILGIAILIKPFKVRNDVIKKEIPILTLITLAMAVLFLDIPLNGAGINALVRADGIILILFFAVFVYYLAAELSNSKDESQEEPKYKLLMSVVIIVLGLVGIIFGSNLVVNNLTIFATSVGISQKIISVTIIAIGTSLPELVTTVVAAKKGENSIAIGNIVGSNIFNICIVLGLPIVLLGEVATTAYNAVDIGFILVSVLLLWLFSATNREIKRYEAAVFILIYCIYGGYVFLR